MGKEAWSGNGEGFDQRMPLINVQLFPVAVQVSGILAKVLNMRFEYRIP